MFYLQESALTFRERDIAVIIVIFMAVFNQPWGRGGQLTFFKVLIT